MSLRFIEPLQSNLLWRYPVPDLSNGFQGLWQQTRQMVLKATYYDQLFPPLWGPLGRAQENLAGIHVCPVDAVIAVGGKCIWNTDTDLDFPEFLKCLHRLLEETSYQTGDGRFWLADNPEAFGFLYQEGQSLRFLPGPVMVLEEHLAFAVKAGAMREIPAAFQIDWNAKILASILKNAVIAFFPKRPSGHASHWISLIEKIDGLRQRDRSSPADVIEILRRTIIATGLNPTEPQTPKPPACAHCGQHFARASDRCSGCGREPQIIERYSFLGERWVYHPIVGRKQYWSYELLNTLSKIPNLEKINFRLAASSDIRVIDILRQEPNGSDEEMLRDIVYLIFGSPSLETDIETSMLKEIVMPIQASYGQTKQFTSSNSAGAFGTEKEDPSVAEKTAQVPEPVPDPEPEMGFKELERIGNQTRTRIEIEGTSCELMILSDENPLGELINLRDSAEFKALDQFPDILSKTSGDGHLEILAASLEEDYVTLNDWSYAHRGEENFYQKLAEILLCVTRSLQQIHLAGYLYAYLTLDRIRVSEDADQVKLQWPLHPIRLGMKPFNLPAPAGYICHEFATKEQNSEPNWDLFSLGAIAFQAISGESPYEDFSSPEIPLHNLRARLPWLPAGWQGLLHRLLAKTLEQRFAKANEVLFALYSFLDKEEHKLTSIVAAAQHTGRTRALKNPANQDRAFYVGKEGSNLNVERDGFEDYDISEAFVSRETGIGLPYIAGVADGISSSFGGAFAAETIMQSFIKLCDKRAMSHQVKDDFVRSLYEAANRLLGDAIIEQVDLHGEREKLLQYQTAPASTLCTLLMTKDHAIIANVGDSRVYLLRRGMLDLLTTDSNRITSLLRQGLTMRAALMRENARELTNWIGRFENGGNQEIDPARPKDITSFEDFGLLSCHPQPGDIFCLCSDGLSKYVESGKLDLGQVLSEHSPAKACRTLINQANELGGTDNISVVVLEVDTI